MEQLITPEVISKSFVWKFLERGAAQVINFVVQIILARLISPEHFGELAIIMAIVNFADIFVQSGICTAIIQKNDLKDIDISTFTLISLAVAGIMYIVLFSLASWISDIYQASVLAPAIRVLALILFFNAINAVQVGILSRRMQFQIIFYRSLIAVPIAGFIGILMAYMKCGIWALVFQAVINAFITCVVMLLGTKMRLSLDFSIQSVTSTLPFTLKIMCSSLISGSHDMIRTSCIGRVYTKEDLAFHDKGLTYSSYITSMITSSVNGVMLPTFSRSQTDIVQLKNILRRSIQITAFFVFPILFGFAAVARSFVEVILTDTWGKAIPYIMLYCILRLPGCIDNIDKQAFLALGKSEILLYYEIISCLLNIILLVLNLFVFPFSNGPFYIALGATIVEYMGLGMLAIVSKKLFLYSFKERLQDVILPLVNSVVMFVVVYGLSMIPINRLLIFVLEIGIGGTIYLLFSFLTKDRNLPYVLRLSKRMFF